MVVSQQRCTFMHTCISTTTLPSTVVYTSAGYEHQRNSHVHKQYKYQPLRTMNPSFTLASVPASHPASPAAVYPGHTQVIRLPAACPKTLSSLAPDK